MAAGRMSGMWGRAVRTVCLAAQHRYRRATAVILTFFVGTALNFSAIRALFPRPASRPGLPDQPRAVDCAFDAASFKAEVVHARATNSCVVHTPQSWPELYGQSCADAAARVLASLDKALACRYEPARWALMSSACTIKPASSLWPSCAEDSVQQVPDEDRARELSPGEAYRVQRYLGSMASASHVPGEATGTTPISVANISRMAGGALLCGERFYLVQSPAEVSTCFQCLRKAVGVMYTKSAGIIRKYAEDLACQVALQEKDVAYLARRQPSLPTLATHLGPLVWMAGDVFPADAVPTLAKARQVHRPGLTVLLPLMHRRHSEGLRAVAAMEALAPAKTFRERQRCALWRGATTGHVGWEEDDSRERWPPRRLLVERWGTPAGLPVRAGSRDTGNVSIDVGYSKLVQRARELGGSHGAFVRPPLPPENMVNCRYLIAAEGNDVATGVKWQLYTESVLLMPAPEKETWLLEGDLVPYEHYVPLRPDFADLGDQLRWCEAHPERADHIARAGRTHVMSVLGATPSSERRVVSAVVYQFRRSVRAVPPPRTLAPGLGLARGPTEEESCVPAPGDGSPQALADFNAALVGASGAAARGDG